MEPSKLMSEMIVPKPVSATFPITAEFGEQNTRYWKYGHKGTDFAVPVGTPVMAVAGGVVQLSRWGDREGNALAILADDPKVGQWRHLYFHLLGNFVQAGEIVKKGQMIAMSGNTGKRLDGTQNPPHLHFQIERWPTRDPIKPIWEFA